MAQQKSDWIGGILHSIVDDVRTLIREELAFARAEIREEISSAQVVGVAFGAAAVAAVVGAVLLSIAIGAAIASLVGWPAWAGYGIVALLMFGSAYLLVRYGRHKLTGVRGLPKTRETVKENLAWMQSKSGEK